MPVQRDLRAYPGLDAPPDTVVLNVLQVRTTLFPEDPGRSIQQLQDQTGLSELGVIEALLKLSLEGEIYSPEMDMWVAVDRD